VAGENIATLYYIEAEKCSWQENIATLVVPAALIGYFKPASTFSNSAFCVRTYYVFRTILTVNSDYFLKQR
jgi:hypothetical protein